MENTTNQLSIQHEHDKQLFLYEIETVTVLLSLSCL